MKRLMRNAFCSILAMVVLLGVASSAAVAAPVLDVDVASNLDSYAHDPGSYTRGDAFARYAVTVKNIGADPTSGTITVAFAFPAGMKLSGADSGVDTSVWTCRALPPQCSTTTVVGAGASLPAVDVRIYVDPTVVADEATTTFTAFGGGASDGFASDTIEFAPALPYGITSFFAGALDSSDQDFTSAGGHPFSAKTSIYTPLRKNANNGVAASVEDLHNLFVDIPPGFVVNPTAVPTTCDVRQVKINQCPDSASVGGVQITGLFSAPTNAALYKIEAEDGYPAAFALRPISIATLVYVIRPKLRSNGDYGVTAVSPLPPQQPSPTAIDFAVLCNYGGKVGGGGTFGGCRQSTDPDALATPLLSNPTDCSAEGPTTTAAIDSFENPASFTADGFPDLSDSNWKTASFTSPPTVGCPAVPFDPTMTITPTSSERDAASGLDVGLDVPQDGLLDHDGLASGHLKKTVVELPEGFSVNPSAASGLQACTDTQIAKDRLTPVDCPDGSKLGTVTATSPLIDQSVEGAMYLGEPKSTDPTSGDMLRLWLVVRNDKLGVGAKLAGSTVADPQTGQLTATFDNNPRLPVDHLEVDLKGGPRGVLSTPQDCGEKTTTATLSPWSGTTPVEQTTNATIGGDCSERFAPKLTAGNSDNRGRGQGGTYSFKFSREDGEQWLQALTAALPKGLLASVKDVPLCSNAAADAGNCPTDSKIGVVDAKAGSGDPFVLEEKGELFLTQGYKGGEYGLAVKVRPVAGPFRGEMELTPIIVRQAVHVDRKTAQVTAISDEFPRVWHGVPLRVREVTVLVNRDKFMLNPSDCEAKTTNASITSTEGTVANLSNPFQASGCAALPFKPKLTLALTGKKQKTTGKHPGVKAKVTQTGIGEAGIEKAVVRLPKSLALDPDNAQALCEFEDGTKDDLEKHCPKGSIVGRARATTPLLNDPLVGNVYFVKNIRTDAKTGNQIRTLPMIMVALRGEIAVNLVGESNTTKSGKLVNTFDNVPDAPVSQFNLNIRGGKNGILAVTRTRRSLINLCAGRHVAEADMDGHNGRRHDRDVRMKTPCSRKQTKAAKRKAKRAAKARNARG
jgi:hypothetical protein